MHLQNNPFYSALYVSQKGELNYKMKLSVRITRVENCDHLWLYGFHSRKAAYFSSEVYGSIFQSDVLLCFSWLSLLSLTFFSLYTLLVISSLCREYLPTSRHIYPTPVGDSSTSCLNGNILIYSFNNY